MNALAGCEWALLAPAAAASLYAAIFIYPRAYRAWIQTAKDFGTAMSEEHKCNTSTGRAPETLPEELRTAYAACQAAAAEAHGPDVDDLIDAVLALSAYLERTLATSFDMREALWVRVYGTEYRALRATGPGQHNPAGARRVARRQARAAVADFDAYRAQRAKDEETT